MSTDFAFHYLVPQTCKTCLPILPFTISSPKLLKHVYRFCQDLNQGFQADHQNHEGVAYFQAFNKRLILLNLFLFFTIRQSIAQKQL
jgi:hypothetical protein